MGQIYRRLYVQNSGDRNLAVDGSLTPVVFDLSYVSFSSFTVNSIHIYAEAKGKLRRYDDFLTIPGLSVGLELDVTSINETFTGQNVKTNSDLKEVFDVGPDINNGGFQKNRVCYRSTIDVGEAKLFVLDKDATVEVTVNDDLTDIDFLSFSLQGNIIE